MATIKVKFRASTVKDKESTLFYQVIRNRLARQIHTGYKLYPTEWDTVCSEIVMPFGIDGKRRDYLLSLKNTLTEDTTRLRGIITRFERTGSFYTADKVVKSYHSPTDSDGWKKSW